MTELMREPNCCNRGIRDTATQGERMPPRAAAFSSSRRCRPDIAARLPYCGPVCSCVPLKTSPSREGAACAGGQLPVGMFGALAVAAATMPTANLRFMPSG